ncbi:PREDICTED: uncharacterized protein LOC106100063, partial [Papilio polytes]|uniref:uncharacterized protein LOC106100063 n=1 Tax=Papilio polytes TaxID=76194 RepID=UPI000676A10B
MFGIKHTAEYKCNISQRDVIAIQNPDWKSVIRDVAEVIFCQILGIPLNKSEEKIIDSHKEKVTFITKATKAVWRRKHSSKMCYLRRSEFLKRQKRMTEETIESETQTFELDFQFDIVFTDEPRKVRVGIKYLNGDKELFGELGKFFSNIINP